MVFNFFIESPLRTLGSRGLWFDPPLHRITWDRKPLHIIDTSVFVATGILFRGFATPASSSNLWSNQVKFAHAPLLLQTSSLTVTPSETSKSVTRLILGQKNCHYSYMARNNGIHIWLSNSQAGLGTTVKQEQEDISRNHVQAFIPGSVYFVTDVTVSGGGRLFPSRRDIDVFVFLVLHILVQNLLIQMYPTTYI